MTPERLRTVRVVVPGTLTIVLAISLLTPNLTLQQVIDTVGGGLKVGTGLYIAIFIAGTLYGLFRARSAILDRHWTRINDNITEQLFATVPAEAFSVAERQRLISSRAVMDVFYSLIDNDETLKVRRGRVYSSGAVVSSLGDAVLFGMIGVVAHLTAVIATHDRSYFYWFLVWSGTFLAAWMLLLPIAVDRHLELSDDQLRFIAAKYPNKVADALRQHLAPLPA